MGEVIPLRENTSGAGDWTAKERQLLMLTYRELSHRGIASRFEFGRGEMGDPWFTLHRCVNCYAFQSITRLMVKGKRMYYVEDRDGEVIAQSRELLDVVNRVLFGDRELSVEVK
jgi:hypothetical protein